MDRQGTKLYILSLYRWGGLLNISCDAFWKYNENWCCSLQSHILCILNLKPWFVLLIWGGGGDASETLSIFASIYAHCPFKFTSDGVFRSAFKIQAIDASVRLSFKRAFENNKCLICYCYYKWWIRAWRSKHVQFFLRLTPVLETPLQSF